MGFWKQQRQIQKAGAPAPDSRLRGMDGAETSVKEIAAAGPALLAFFKISCPVCQLTLPFLERIHTPGALAIYGISQDDAADTREFNKRYGLTFPVLLDPEEDGYRASNAFGISTVPSLFLVERDGTVSRVIEGWQRAEIEWLGQKAGVEAIRSSDSVPAWKAG